MSDLLALSQNCLRNADAVQPRCATVPGTTVRLLTKTSKMPGPSWSLPAHRACPRANGSICQDSMRRKAAIGGFDERDRVSYGGPYDTSKAAMELIVRMYHSTYWGDVLAIGITRCASVFGYGDTNPRRVIPLFVTTAINDKNIPLRFRLNGRRFIYITDAIGGYFGAISSLKESSSKPTDRSPFTPTYHFAIEEYPGTDQPYIQMKALAELTAGLFGAGVTEVQCVDYATNENRIQALSCKFTRDELGWQTQVSLPDGLGKLGEWYAASGDVSALRRLMRDELDALVSSLRDERVSARSAS